MAVIGKRASIRSRAALPIRERLSGPRFKYSAERMRQGHMCSRWHDEARVAHDMTRFADIGHHAWDATRHRFTHHHWPGLLREAHTSTSKPGMMSSTSSRCSRTCARSIIPAWCICRIMAGSPGAAPRPIMAKCAVRTVCSQRSSPRVVGMVLDGVIASYQSYQNGVVGDLKHPTQPPACPWAGSEATDVYAVGNHKTSVGFIAHCLVLAPGRPRVVDNSGWLM